MFNQLWIGAAIAFSVFHQVSHTGTQFVRAVNLSEKRGDHGMFGEWHKSHRIDHTETVRAIGVICGYLAVLITHDLKSQILTC